MNIKKVGRRNIRKHWEIKDGDKYITLDNYLKFGSLDTMKMIPLQPIASFVRSVNRLFTSPSLNTIDRPKK